jgi:carbon monoxide dehydrogenase subunit G
MELEHEFTVAAPVDKAWDVLLDLDRVVPCMPGAALTSYDGESFGGTVKVKLGPVSMTFAGKGRFVERDETARRVVVEASGKDARGGGTAKATVRAVLSAAGPDATDVKVNTDLAVTGRVAQFGRGMVADVSSRLLGQFTDCLQGKLGEGVAGGVPASPAPETSAVAAAAAPATAATPDSPAPAPVPSPRPAATVTRAPAEVEPVDLLAVTGVSGAAKRSLPYIVIFVVGAVAGGVLVRWLS